MSEEVETPADLENRLSTLVDSINSSQLSESEILSILQSNSNISEFDLDVYIQNITKYTKQRSDLMKEIYDISRVLEEDAEYNAEEFEQQVKVLLISEQRLRETKMKLKILEDYEQNRQREVSNTTYYRKYFRAWSSYMGLFFVILLANIIIGYLVFKKWIPFAILIISVLLSLFYLYLVSWDLRKRDKLIFDEYDWGFDPNNVSVTTYKSSEEEPVAATEEESQGTTCASTVAASIQDSGGSIICEPGKIYDAALFKCITPTDDQKLSVIRAMWNASGCPNSDLINDTYVTDGGEWALTTSFSSTAAEDMNRICVETVAGTADTATAEKCGDPATATCPGSSAILAAGTDALGNYLPPGDETEGFSNYSSFKTVLME